MSEKNYQTGVGLTVAELYQPVVKHEPVKVGDKLVSVHNNCTVLVAEQCLGDGKERAVLIIVDGSDSVGDEYSMIGGAVVSSHSHLTAAEFKSLTFSTSLDAFTRNGVKLSDIYAEPKSDLKPLRIGDCVRDVALGYDYLVAHADSGRVGLMNLKTGGRHSGPFSVGNVYAIQLFELNQSGMDLDDLVILSRATD